ncbi:hypothetical protein pb186bvf_016704 [Paramecium bursaria]
MIQQFEIIETKGNMVQVKMNEETWMLLENFLVRQQVFQEISRGGGALKNIIPVMLNKFTKWLSSLNPQEVMNIKTKIKKIRNNRQNMSIKDLQQICQDEQVKEYWISFLENGSARDSIQKMKNSTNKLLYEQQIGDLLREVLEPKIRGKPYKGFISQTRRPPSIYGDFDPTDQDLDLQDSYIFDNYSQSYTQRRL